MISLVLMAIFVSEKPLKKGRKSILRGEMQFSNGCKINNYLFIRLGKVVISRKLIVFEVRNKKQTCCNIIFEYSRGWKKRSIQNYRRVRGRGHIFL